MSEELFRGRRVLWMPFEAPWRPPSEDVRFCCEAMTGALRYHCEQHADPFECADHLMIYNEVLDELGIVVHDGGPSYVLVTHCPWCGARLPASQRDRWFEETETLGEGAEIPERYLSGAWRR